MPDSIKVVHDQAILEAAQQQLHETHMTMPAAALNAERNQFDDAIRLAHESGTGPCSPFGMSRGTRNCRTGYPSATRQQGLSSRGWP